MADVKVVSGLASGAFPTATFPCDHLKAGQAGTKDPVDSVTWAKPELRATASLLQKAVNEADWSGLFAEGKTVCQMQPAWSASSDRCNLLRCFCSMLKAKRVLEIGAFCGVASLSIAEILPADGEVVSLDIDPYPFEQVGKEVKAASPHFSKVRFLPGSAQDSLELIKSQHQKQQESPFDLVVIDADKAGMRGYFDLICDTPGLLADGATICVDMTPFKGVPPDRYVRFGQADRWQQNSGQEEIDNFRAHLAESGNFETFDVVGMLVVRRR